MKRVLIVSPHFPPVNAPDHQRVRMSLPYFRECGWEPVVLAVDPARVDAPRDLLLAATISSDIPIHRVNAWPFRFTRPFGFGNIGYRSWFQLRAAGDRLLQPGTFDLVYFSTTQFLVTTLGAGWQRRFAVPYVVDLQDPWRTDYYARPGAPRPPGGWKYRFAHWQAEQLEERAWRGAAGFISVSDGYLTQLRSRYAWFAAKPTAVIPFGASPGDLALAQSRNDIAPAFAAEAGTINFVSVGAVGPIMREALQCLFSALRQLRETDPIFANRLRFHFIGTSYATGGRASDSVRPIAVEYGVENLVRENRERIGYLVALKTMLAADGIVILGSGDAAYNPSKIASCFLVKKPALILAPRDSMLERAALELGFATIAFIGEMPGDSRVEYFLRNVSRDPAIVPLGRDISRFDRTHTAQARTHQQCELFERVLASGSQAKREGSLA